MLIDAEGQPVERLEYNQLESAKKRTAIRASAVCLGLNSLPVYIIIELVFSYGTGLLTPF